MNANKTADGPHTDIILIDEVIGHLQSIYPQIGPDTKMLMAILKLSKLREMRMKAYTAVPAEAPVQRSMRVKGAVA